MDSSEHDAIERPARVFVVDDSPLFLRAVRPVIAAAPEFALVGTATSGERALDELERSEVDLLLVDVHLPGINGIDVAHRYRERGGRAVIVLMSTSALVDLPRSYLDADVAGFLPKELLSTGALRRLWESQQPERQ